MNSLAAALADDLLGRGRGVDVNHADHVVAALHGHAHRLADAHLQDAGRRVPAVVLAGVAGEHAFVPLQHVIEDRLADGDLLVGGHALAGAAHLGLELLGLRIDEHDAAAVGLDPFENQFHDPLQQLIDVQRVADGQGRAVHHLEIAADAGQPRIWAGSASTWKMRLPSACVTEWMIRERSSRVLAARQMSTPISHLAGVVGGAGIEHQRAADLHLVAAGERECSHPLAVDEGPVGAVQIDER